MPFASQFPPAFCLHQTRIFFQMGTRVHQSSSRRRIVTKDDPSALRLGAVNIYPIFRLFEQTLKLDEFSLSESYAAVYQEAISIITFRLEQCDTKLLVEISRLGMVEVIALVVYSLENPKVYQDLNYFTRTVSVASTIKQLGQSTFNKDISLVMLCRDLFSSELKPTHPVEKTLYRGVSSPCKGKIGDTMSLMQFTSASTDQNEALNFLLESDEPTKNRRTMQEFIGGHLKGIDMQHISDIPDEKEVLLFPYQSFTIVDIVEETITTLSETLTLQTFKLRSELPTALTLFDTVSRHFPPFLLSITAEKIFIVESVDKKLYQLNGEQLKHFKFQSSAEELFTLKKALPEYHIIGTCTFLPKIQTPTLIGLLRVSLFDVSVVHIVLNIAVLEKAIERNQPVYLRLASKYSYDNTNLTLGPTINIKLVPRDAVIQILKVCKQESENVTEEGQSKPTTYVISSGQHLKHSLDEEQQIPELFPAAARPRLVIRHIPSDHFMVLSLQDYVMGVAKLGPSLPFTFRLIMSFAELKSSAHKYFRFVYRYLLALLFMLHFDIISEELSDLFCLFLIPLALYPFVWIWLNTTSNNVRQD